MKDSDFMWLVGLLEGEGTFCKAPPTQPTSPFLAVNMTDKDIVSRVADLFGVACCSAGVPKKSHWKPSYKATLRGAKAVHLMQLLKPHMGIRRQQQIESVISSYTHVTKRLTYDQICTILQRCASGESHSSVANDYGLDRSTVSYWCKGKKLPKWFVKQSSAF